MPGVAAGLQANHKREPNHVKLSVSFHYLSQTYEHYHFTQIISTHSNAFQLHDFSQEENSVV